MATAELPGLRRPLQRGCYHGPGDLSGTVLLAELARLDLRGDFEKSLPQMLDRLPPEKGLSLALLLTGISLRNATFSLFGLMVELHEGSSSCGRQIEC